MALGIIATISLSAVSGRERVLIDSGWRFQLGDPADVTPIVTSYPEIADLAKVEPSQLTGNGSETHLQAFRLDPVVEHAGENVSFVMTNYNDSGWRTLNLPHDWVVELPFDSSADGSHGFKPVGNPSFTTNNVGWYRRTFTIPSGYAGQTLWLDFDGAYRNSLVWLNGHILGRNVSGYTSFYYDITPYANPGGTNVLVVRVDANRFEGWFYEGAGIYRHAWLTAINPVHVAHWGTYVTTTNAGANAIVTVQTTVTNQSSSPTVNGKLISTILDANSNAVTAVTSNLNLAAGQGLVVTQKLTVANAKLWSLQTPYLYKLVTTVSNASAVADVYQTPFGVRTVSFDSVNGFSLNGQRVEIFGACNHQDAAGVGAAVPDRLLYYRLERMKQMGVNAYRTSHNAPAAELLDACDRLGILVLDENRRMGTNAEPLNEMSRLILRDRNHPSVFAWALGNEEYYIQASWTAENIYTVMQNLAHALDPTRSCTMPINGSYWDPSFAMVEDVVGVNYDLGDMYYSEAYYSYRKYLGTEVASTVSTRGIYTNDSSAGYCSAYDLELNNDQLAETWFPFFHAYPWTSGGFIWTGFDYRGEPTPYWWPDINSHFGVMDTCGFPKDNFYYYQANWTLKPVLHIFPHWNWGTPGQPVNIWVYGNCDLAELFLNGVSQGQRALNVLGHAEWDNVPYAPGTLRAVGYLNGDAIITNTVATAGTPAAIALWPDRSTILADGRDVSVVTVAVLDSLGRVVPVASNLVYFAVSGGAIIGVGNGNPTCLEADKASQRTVFNGFAQVIVQSTNQPGSITLTATSFGLTTTNITITEAATPPAPATPTGVTAVGGDGQVTVSWDIVPGAISYNLRRATTGGGPYTLIATNIGGVNLGYADTDVENDTPYYYVVSAVNENGESVNSLQVSATPHTPPIPAPPTGLTAIPGDGLVSLSWTASSGAYAYNIKYSTTSGGPYTLAQYLGDTSFSVSGLTDDTTYYFVVSALNGSGESDDSGEVSATPTPIVTSLAATVVDSQVQLQWDEYPDVTGYNVKRSLVSGGPYTTIAASITSNSFTDTDVTLCQTYYYVVTITNADGEGIPSPEVSATVLDVLPPEFTSADVGYVGLPGSALYCGGQFTISGSGGDIWGTSDAFQFVYEYLPVSTNCDIRARVVSVPYTHSNAKAAVMIRESLDPASRHALVDVTPNAGMELLFRTDTGGSTYASTTGGGAPNWVRLTRTNNTFTAYYSGDGDTWFQIGSPIEIDMAVGAYVGLAVCAHNNGELNTSVLDNVSISPAPPVMVSGLTATAVNSQVQLKWRAHDGATGYSLQRSSASGGPYTIIASNLTSIHFTDTNVSSCQTYFYIATMTIGGVETVPCPAVSVLVSYLTLPYQSMDIGPVGLAGSASSCGPLIVTGSGNDIWDYADEFQFVYVPMNGDGEIRARVVSLQNTDPWAKAGVMIRESLTTDSRNDYMCISSSSGAQFQYRTETGDVTDGTVAPGTITAPYWVRLTRAGNMFRAYISANGTSWTQVGGNHTSNMASDVYAGLAVTAHNDGQLNSSVFMSVYVSSITPRPPTVIQNPVGATRYVNGSYTLSATLSGGIPLNYQWQLNGTPVFSGSTNGMIVSLPLSNLTADQAGNYILYVTNYYGCTNTTPATLTVLTPLPGGYTETILTKGPVAYWRLNETGTPATAFDYAGGNDLANTNVTSTNGVPGAGFEALNIAAWYNGTNSGSIGSVPLMNSMTNFTICGWFKADSMPQPARTALFGQKDLAEFGFHNSALGIWVATPDPAGVLLTNSTVTLNPNTWYFVAATGDGDNINFYLNGSLLSSLPGTLMNYFDSNDPFRIGYGVLDGSHNYFNGAMDEVALFDRALTPAELQSLYNAAIGIPNVLMNIHPLGTNVKLTWSPPVGTLQAATNVFGVYSNVPGATSPYTNPISGPQKYFRVWVQ